MGLGSLVTILDYDLPVDRIAEFPLEDRASSKLLVARPQQDAIEHRRFYELPSLLPAGSILVLNDTRVIHARLIGQKPTGGAAEILCLSPVLPSRDPAVALEARGEARWEALVGGKRIPAGTCLRVSAEGLEIEADILERRGAEATVHLRWRPAELSFSAVLERAGKIPLPPYFKRAAEESDRERYQTVYSRTQGSVAAPTAGLHFTPAVLSELTERGIRQVQVTLHVGAGTFKPVESVKIEDHPMHAERIIVSPAALAQIRDQVRSGKPLVAVGTTSMRTLESLYWIGVRLLRGELEASALISGGILLETWDWQRLSESGELAEATRVWEALASLPRGVEGETRILIAPGYGFRVCDGLITNFHQPRSTLLLLIAAFTGGNFWRRIYQEALDQGYRFLSYGDSSLLWRG